MRNGLTAGVAAVVVAVAGGIWYAAFRGESEYTRVEPPPSETQSRSFPVSSGPVDLSNPLPEVRVASAFVVPAPVMVNEPAIRGIVIDTSGDPVVDAAVTVYDVEQGPRRGFADRAGNFAVGDLASDRGYRVSAVKAGYNDAVEEGISAGAGDIVLVLTATSTAAGRVVDESGRPVERFEVAYLNPAIEDATLWKEIVRSGATRWRAFADPGGRYEIAEVASDAPFSLGARAEGFEPAVILVPPVAPAERASPADIVLKAGARIAGRVLTPQRVPVPHATVYLGPDTDGPVLARTDGAGGFVSSGFGDATIDLTADHDTYLPATVRVSPRRGDVLPVDIVLGQGGVLAGRVTRGGQPSPGQTVLATRLIEPRIQKQAVTGPDGRYRIEGLDVGPLDVLAKLPVPGGSPLRIQLQAEIAYGAVTTLDFDFPVVLGTIEGWLTANGAPVAFAEVRGTLDSAGGQSTFFTTAREDGFYRIGNVAPGMATVTVDARANDAALRRTLIADVRGGAVTRLDVDFDQAAALVGVVSNLASNEVGQVFALAGHDDVDVSTPEAVLRLESAKAGESDIDEAGQFMIIGLEPGEFTLVALVFQDDAETGDDAIDSVRVGVEKVTLPESGSAVVTLALSR